MSFWVLSDVKFEIMARLVEIHLWEVNNNRGLRRSDMTIGDTL